MSKNDYQTISGTEINHLLNGELILIVTATDLETSHTHNKIKPLEGYDKTLKLFEGDLTYYFGKFGNYNIAHVQSSMGSLSRSSSIMTISTALNKLNAKIVVMVGIAFGVNEQKQKIGDVLISESIIPYNSKRVGRKETILRGIEEPASKILLNRFKNAKTTWEHITEEDYTVKLIPTRLLSGEELIDNIEHRKQLIKLYPESKGGEMEGVGLSAACSNKVNWIIVKGICDFADGEKNQNKTSHQEIAINAALSLCLNVFESANAFKDLGIDSISRVQNNICLLSQQEKIETVLFNIYDVDKEPYYVHRNDDDIFNATLEQSGIWIHGITGCGKTNLIIRNLQSQKQNFILICLASCTGNDSLSSFIEILLELAEKTDRIITKLPKKFTECCKEILKILNECYSNKRLVIFIEEIPINTDKDYKDFLVNFFSLITSINLFPKLEKIRFVLSSINNPAKYIQGHQQKIHSHLKFIPLKNFQDENVRTLIAMIEKELNCKLSEELKNRLIKTSKGSPRFIKHFFKTVFVFGYTDSNLEIALKETNSELNQNIND